jgi:dihydrofolate reductase
MRKLIVSNLMSLDGFFEGPDHELDWFAPDEEFFAYAREMLRAVDTIIFGRVTYQHMAAYWPSAPKEEIADAMNHLPKIVFSRTLDKTEWNNCRLVKGDAVEEIAELKHQPGKDMVILGSAMLASTLLQQGLIDEYRVIVSPILIGSGYPLFKGITNKIRLKLEKNKLLSSGVAVLYYQKA